MSAWLWLMGALIGPDVTWSGEGAPAMRERLTVSAAVETMRFMVDEAEISPLNPQGAVSISPDGKRWVARLVRGDVLGNAVTMELVAGSLATLSEAAKPRTVARLSSSGLGAGEGRAGANQDTSAYASPLRWVDREHVAFAWSDAAGHRQVTRIDVSSGQTEVLTAQARGVLNFDVTVDGTVVYSSPAPDRPRDLVQQLRSGLVIEPETDAGSIIRGRVNEGSVIDRLWRTQWFVQRPGEAPVHVAVAGRDESPNPMETVWLSRRGRWALIHAIAPAVPLEWDRYEAWGMVQRVRYARTNPHSMLGRLVYQLWVLDTASGESHALWSAPSDPEAVRCAWSADERAVLIAPAFLPAEAADVVGLHGAAAVIVERDTGRYHRLPLDLRDREVTSVQWIDPARVVVASKLNGAVKRDGFERIADEWRRVDQASPAATGVRLELRQDLDTPPVLMAVESATQRTVRVIDPNPSLLRRYDIGRTRIVEGPLGAEARWQGLLFYPPDFDPRRRYPLVIQSVYGGAIRPEFTLYGNLHGYGLGPPVVPPYPGRMLAQYGVLVLQLNILGEDGSSTPREGGLRVQAFERAAQQLIDEGVVDGTRVGLIGFSRNGFFVEYVLTHSDFPYAAAIAVDHWQPDYVAQTLLGYDAGGKDVNGGLPFGAGLQRWFEATPGFNAQRVRTPLLEVEQSHGLMGVLLHWELFSRLRYLQKPVELWMIPNAQFAVHNTQNPEQIVAMQTRVIDWFRFWLKREEDADPAKDEQYVRWRALRVLQDAQAHSQ